MRAHPHPPSRPTTSCLLDKTDAAAPRYLTCPTRRWKLVCRVQRSAQLMDGQQLLLGPFAKLWQLSIRREAPDLCKHLLSGCEVGQR